MLLTTQGCARLRTGPIIMQIPRGYQKKKRLLCRKARYVRSLGKKPNFWPSQRLKKLTGTLSGMHKGPKCIQSLWEIRKKFLLCKSTKKARYVRSLGKKPHFGAFPEAKKGVVNYARLRTGPIIMQTPRGYQNKKVTV